MCLNVSHLTVVLLLRLAVSGWCSVPSRTNDPLPCVAGRVAERRQRVSRQTAQAARRGHIPRRMLQVVVCGALVFPGLFFAFRRILPSVFREWSDADVVLVSERLVSSTHAVMATTAGVIILSSCWGNVINDRHWLATYFVIWYGVPYMTYDLYAMYLSHHYRFRVKGHEEYKQHSLRTVNSFIRREFLLVLHHIALLTILLPVTLFFRKDQGDFFIGCLFLTELSTPFVSLGKILIQLSLQDSWLHKANGGMVLLTFFMCRIALFPFMYWMYGRQYGIPLYGVPLHLPLSVNLGNLCILAPQVYWFVLLCRKGYRLYQRSRCRQDVSPTSPTVMDSAMGK